VEALGRLVLFRYGQFSEQMEKLQVRVAGRDFQGCWLSRCGQFSKIAGEKDLQ
jgi:hypothetical protein